MTLTAISWLAGMVFCAVPYYLSGQYLSFLDACFDVMSGFTTTGLTLIQDMDHTANGINMWRHLLTFVGGQGMIVLAITFLVKGTNGAYKMYVGEGKDERLMPNVVSTARYIWGISLVYLLLGTAVLTVIGFLKDWCLTGRCCMACGSLCPVGVRVALRRCRKMFCIIIASGLKWAPWFSLSSVLSISRCIMLL